MTCPHPNLELLELGPDKLAEFNPQSVFKPNSEGERKILCKLTEELVADTPVSVSWWYIIDLMIHALFSYSHSTDKMCVVQYDSATFLCQEILRASREKVFDIIVTHPFYIGKDSCYERQLRVQQELVRFFDRRLTYHVAQLMKVYFPIGDRVLRIGGWGDYLFKEVDAGSYDHEEIEQLNKETWKFLSKS